ncbi:MAG: hypothetical protein V1900_04710 [Candidatus Aenigmatarchaeota archaeon]
MPDYCIIGKSGDPEVRAYLKGIIPKTIGTTVDFVFDDATRTTPSFEVAYTEGSDNKAYFGFELKTKGNGKDVEIHNFLKGVVDASLMLMKKDTGKSCELVIEPRA